MQIIQYDPLELNSMDVDAEHPGLGYQCPIFAGACVGAEPEASDRDLEREVCSNFTCCGLILDDMHALVDHFEETHVFAPKPGPLLSVLPEDRPILPPPRLVIPFPRFLTPPPIGRVPASYDSPASPLWSDGLPSPVPGHSLPSYLAPSSHAAPSPSSLPPASFSAGTSHKRPSKAKPLQNRERVGGGRFRSRRSESSPTKRERGSSRRDRGRNYICPTPDCVKTYLNPNGLQYHMEKGTCQAADGSAL